MKNALYMFFCVLLTVAALAFAREFHGIKRKVEKLEKSSHSWVLEPYQYVITLDDSFWVTVRHADGTVVGQVWCDTTTQIGKLFYNDNQ